MTPAELKRIFQNGECLSLETMRLYQSSKLSSKSMHEVEKHLLECGLCASALEGLSPKNKAAIDKVSTHIQRRLAIYMNTPPRLSFFQRYGFTLASLALILAIGGGVWIYQSTKTNTPDRIDTAQVSPPAQTPPPQNPSSNTDDRPEAPVDFASTQTQTTVTTSEFTAPTAHIAPPDKQKNPLPLQQNTKENKTQTNPEPLKAQAPTESHTANSNPTEGPNTRVAAPAPLRMKSVIVLNKVEHTTRSARDASSGSSGQLGKSTKSNGGFQLDEMPQFPGGDAALREYVLSNFKMPGTDRAKLSRLATGITFVVNAKTGEISDVVLNYSISPEIDAELIRVVKAMPRWNPGSRRGSIDVILGITLE